MTAPSGPVAPEGTATPAEVLRYWLQMIRHEEALGVAVRAAPPAAADRIPNMAAPERGQIYFKLARDPEGETVDVLFRKRLRFRLPIVGDRASFFEHWLGERYRRERFEKQKGPEVDDSRSELVIGFPTLYASRRGELLTLLRFSAERLVFFTPAGEPFTPPSYRTRQSGVATAPPAELEVVLPELGPELPFSVDENVLSRHFGVQEEHVGLLGRWLREEGPHGPEAIAHALTVLLKLDPAAAVESTAAFAASDGQRLDANELFDELVQLCRARALGELAIFPMGLAWDGGATYATHHLQRDLDELIAGGVDIARRSALGRYLLRDPRPASRRLHLGRHSAPLTEGQRLVAERFLGSTLTVAEGPPGTGKTALILALAAHSVIERHMAEDAFGEVPVAPVLVVASTNNRAVDNVIDTLSIELPEDRLPIALRVGSRTVLATVTRGLLERTIRWLDAARTQGGGLPVGDSDSKAARERFRTAVSAFKKAERDVRKSQSAVDRIEALTRERVTTERALAEAERRVAETKDEDDEAMAEALVWTRAAGRAATAAGKRLAKQGAAGIDKTARAWADLEKAWPPAAAGILARAGAAVSWQAPEDKADLDAWEEAWATLEDELDTAERVLRGRVDAADLLSPETLRERLEAQETELGTLGPVAEALATLYAEVQAERSDIEPGLYEDALMTRELWAASNAERLTESVKAALRELEHRGTLRPMAERETPAWRDLQRLFPVWGCTLLSIPNVFPATPDSLARVVIDEAGQCHPAHAVTALWRASQALLIGDTNQLEPVVELDAREEWRVIRRARGTLNLDRLGPYRTLANRLTSAQSLGAEAVEDVPRLRDHFRCQPEIIAISNRLCDYDLRVHTPRASLALLAPRLRAPVLGVDVDGAQEPFLGSWRNNDEVRAAVTLVAELVQFGVAPGQIALLTPYRGQLRALRDALRVSGLAYDDGDVDNVEAQGNLFGGGSGGVITTGTVHRFQGGERDVVVFSSVVTESRSLPFMNQRRNLVNVAVSRARLHFVLVGHSAVLSQGPITREIVAGVGKDGWLGRSVGERSGTDRGRLDGRPATRL